MPLDPHARRFLRLLAASRPSGPLVLTVEQRRQGVVELMKLGGTPQAVARVENLPIAGPGGPLALRLYTPLNVTDPILPGLVYFHGGGLIAGSLDTHDGIARALANASKCRVVAVDYRLAPEHPVPAAIEDAEAAVRQVAAEAQAFGINAERLGVAGDSAGGTLAAVSCHTLARTGGPTLKLQLLLCPIVDYTDQTPSRRDFGEGYLVDQATLDHELECYLPSGVDAHDPRVSPLLAKGLMGLPPTIMHTAECDPLRDGGKGYFDRLRETGCGLSYTCHAGMIHLFYALGSILPQGISALSQMGGEIRAAMA